MPEHQAPYGASQFPWADVKAFDDWCKAYAAEPSLDNLNGLRICAGIMFGKLSTFAMEQNAKRMEG
jgi:hypothetical protein